MVLGFLGAFLLARWRARREGVPVRHIENLLLLAILTGVGGSMVFGKIFYEHRSLWDALKIWQPGDRVFYGGFICAVLSVATYAWLARLPILRVLDVCAPSVALGSALGRVGCFLGGCCWGDACVPRETLAGLSAADRAAIQSVPWLNPAGFPLAVTYPSNSLAYQNHQELGLIAAEAARSLPVHPVQLYDAVGALALCWYLHRSFDPGRRDGAVAARLLIGYALLRFTSEFFRADNPPQYAGLTLAQVTAAVLVFATLAGAAAVRRFTARKPSSSN